MKWPFSKTGKSKGLAAAEVVKEEAKVEVIAHKRATKRQVNEVKKVNQSLNEMLDANGFTLKIYLAAGGRQKTKGKT